MYQSWAQKIAGAALTKKACKMVAKCKSYNKQRKSSYLVDSF